MKRLIVANTLDVGIPYQLVSMAAIIRDFDEPKYKNAEHKALTDIADFLYNVGLGSDYLKDEPKKLYDRYGKEYWDKVLEDMSAIDSQLDGHGNFNYHLRKEEELLADYNDRIGITASTKVTASSRYTLYGTGDDILAEGDNKADLIKKARSLTTPATVEDNKFKGIIFENDAQRKINNGEVYSSTKVTASELISTDGPDQLVRVVDLLEATEGFNIDDIDGNNIYYSIDYSIIREDEAEDILNEIDMITVYGSTKVTASTDSEIIDRANEVVDYLISHNRNLNRKQDALVAELSDAVQTKSVRNIRRAIEELQNNSKRLNNKQYALVSDLYDDFNLANGKFNGMGKVESSTNATISASNNPFIRIYIEEGRDLTPKAYRAYLDSGKVIGVIGGEYYIADNEYGKNAKYMGDFFNVKKYFEDLASINPITSATNPQADDYRLLDRLKSDCDYVLNNYTGGKLAEKHLWAGSTEDQIAKMYELYDSLKVKPEWITHKDIDEYARRFEEILNQ